MPTTSRAVTTSVPTAAALLWLALAACAPFAHALDTSLKATQYIYRDWTRADGLPSNVVWSLTYGQSGYLWLATEGGLARFDGVRFEVFNSETRSAFRVNDIRDVVQDSDGHVWAATYGGGVVRVAGTTVRRYGVEHGLDSEIVYAVVAARDGAIWAGTSTGICRLPAGASEFSCWTEADGLPTSRYLRAAEGDAGDIWFSGLGNGVVRFLAGELKVFGAKDGLDATQVYALANDPGHGMFLADYSGAMYRGTPNGIERLEDFGVGENDVIWDAVRDESGNLWLALNTGGVRTLAAESYELAVNSALSATVLSMVLGGQDDLWIGTDEGLRHVRRGSALPYGEPEGISNGTFVVAAGDDNSVWIGAESDGLFRVASDGEIDRWTTDEGLPASSVSALRHAADGTLWVGTFGGGLAHLSQTGDVLDVFDTESGLGSNQVISLYESDAGELWVGTAGGVNRIVDGRVIQSVTSDDGLPVNVVRHINADRQGKLWLSTESGLAVFDPERDQIVERLDAGSGLQSSVIVTTHIDDSGAVWVGSRVDGLARIDGAEQFVFTAQHGIGLRSIMGIAEDQTGGLWLVGRDGTMRVDKASLEAVAAGRAERVESRLLSEQDGLRTVRIPGGYQSPIAVLDNGEIWLASARGAARVNLDGLGSADIAQPLLIESVLIDGVSFGVEQVGSLPVDTKALEIHYSVPDLIAADRFRFRYRIRGQGQQWQDAGARRTAFFTDPRPGRNVFEVQVTNAGDPFGDEPHRIDSLDFTVTPRWYHRRVVQGGALFVGLIFAGFLYRRLIRGHKSRQITLEQTLEDRSAALQKALKKIDSATATDALTGLANRRSFTTHLETVWSQAREKAQSLNLMLLSIDCFGDYNEFAGMRAGDALLRQVADRLSQQLRREDLLARVGDSEFAVLFDDSEPGFAIRVAEQLQRSVGELGIQHKGRPKGNHVTLSAGLSSIEARAVAETDAIVRRANQALQRAKTTGRNQVVVDSALSAVAS
ncbi:MAG: diguanylate cyclase [Pseudomonadota bacterium]